MIVLLIVLWLRRNHSEIISRCLILTFQTSGDNIFISSHQSCFIKTQKQPSRGVLIKRCSENLQEIYRRMPKCDFNKVALQLYSNRISVWVFSCRFLHIFRTPFSKNTSGWLLLKKSVLKNFAKFTGKLLWEIATLFKKGLFHRYWAVNFSNFSIALILQSSSGILILYLANLNEWTSCFLCLSTLQQNILILPENI